MGRGLIRKYHLSKLWPDVLHNTKHFHVYARFEVLTVVRSSFLPYDAMPISK